MPFSSGTYTVAIDFATEAASPPIEIAKLDQQMVDIATALSTCMLRDGTGTPTATIPFGSQDVTGMKSLTITQTASDANALILSRAGSRISIARSSDGAANSFIIGSDTVGGSGLSLKQAGGTHAEMQLMGSGIINLLTNDLTRVSIAAAGAVSVNAPTSGPAIIAGADTAITAAGNLRTGIAFTSTANFGVFCGSGAPTISTAKGSLYLRSDATTNVTRAYINTDGAGTWTAINTVA